MINLLLIFIFVLVSMYVSSYHIDHFEVSSSSGKLIKPTCNRNTIYNLLNLLFPLKKFNFKIWCNV